MFDTYIEAFVHYLLRIHGDARGWRAKRVRYFDITKPQYFDVSKLTNIGQIKRKKIPASPEGVY